MIFKNLQNPGVCEIVHFCWKTQNRQKRVRGGTQSPLYQEFKSEFHDVIRKSGLLAHFVKTLNFSYNTYDFSKQDMRNYLKPRSLSGFFRIKQIAHFFYGQRASAKLYSTLNKGFFGDRVADERKNVDQIVLPQSFTNDKKRSVDYDEVLITNRDIPMYYFFEF